MTHSALVPIPCQSPELSLFSQLPLLNCSLSCLSILVRRYVSFLIVWALSGKAAWFSLLPICELNAKVCAMRRSFFAFNYQHRVSHPQQIVNCAPPPPPLVSWTLADVEHLILFFCRTIFKWLDELSLNVSLDAVSLTLFSIPLLPHF